MFVDAPIIRPIPEYDGRRSFRERQRRRQKDLNRLANEVQSVILALPHIQFRDCDIERPARDLQILLGTTEIVPVPVRCPKGSTLLIVVPMRVWHDAEIRKRMWRLRTSSVVDGVPTVRLLTQKWIRRRPFLDNCKLVARYANLSVAASDRCSVQTLVREDPLASIEECASVVKGRDPFGVVLALVAGGLLTIDFETAITPLSAVSERKLER